MRKMILLGLAGLTTSVFSQNLTITEKGRYTDGRETASEIATYDSASAKIFVTNAVTDSIDILDMTDPSAPSYAGGISISAYGGGINSVVNLGNGFIAAAIEANNKQDSGHVVFFGTDGSFAAAVKVGALPDMVTVTKDGNKVLVACEGEPSDDYLNDPEGCIGIIDISGGVSSVNQSNVTLLRFTGAPASIPGGVRKPGTPWTQDLEPEYIATSVDSKKAFVTCQEANVMILVDLENNTITGYKGLGFKDHNVAGQGLDASDKDSKVNITTWMVKGIYMPDAIYAYDVEGSTYIVSANEGDGRDYSGYSSETRIKDLTLDAAKFPNAAFIQADSNLGRLKTLTEDVIGDTDNDLDVDELYSYGARSFSIWDANGDLVWDSGDEIEQYMFANHPDFFNCDDGTTAEMDKRSDDKGPEPEAIVVCKIGLKYFAFIGLERQGGIMVYDVTDPQAPVFETFVNSYNETTGLMTDIAPEGLTFVPASKSHTGNYLLIASNEVSGTTTIYEIVDKFDGIATESTSVKFSVYPNPTQDLINIDIQADRQSAYQFRLINAYGQLMATGRLVNGNQVISLDGFAEGIYTIVVKSADGSLMQSEKVLKF